METEETDAASHNVSETELRLVFYKLPKQFEHKTLCECGIWEISYSLHSSHNDFDLVYKGNFM